MISFEHKFIFFENQKCASTSICAALLPLININKEKELCPTSLNKLILRHEEVYNRHVDRYGAEFGLWRDGHYAPRRYRKLLKEYGDSSYDDFIKCGVVRNPWDRLVSAYFHKNPEACKCGSWDTKRMDKLSKFKNFTDFCLHSDEEPFFRTGHFGIQMNFYKNVMGSTYFLPFHKLTEQFLQFSQRYLNGEVKLDKHLNKSPHRSEHYREHYTRQTREIVRERYERDIDAFGFEF